MLQLAYLPFLHLVYNQNYLRPYIMLTITNLSKRIDSANEFSQKNIVHKLNVSYADLTKRLDDSQVYDYEFRYIIFGIGSIFLNICFDTDYPFSSIFRCLILCLVSGLVALLYETSKPFKDRQTSHPIFQKVVWLLRGVSFFAVMNYALIEPLMNVYRADVCTNK